MITSIKTPRVDIISSVMTSSEGITFFHVSGKKISISSETLNTFASYAQRTLGVIPSDPQVLMDTWESCFGRYETPIAYATHLWAAFDEGDASLAESEPDPTPSATQWADTLDSLNQE